MIRQQPAEVLARSLHPDTWRRTGADALDDAMRATSLRQAAALLGVLRTRGLVLRPVKWKRPAPRRVVKVAPVEGLAEPELRELLRRATT